MRDDSSEFSRRSRARRDRCLRLYLKVRDKLDEWFLVRMNNWFSVGHPKNDYDYRSRDFVRKIERNDRVADLGCGVGKIVKAITPHCEFAVGLDYKRSHDLRISDDQFLLMDIFSPEIETVLSRNSVNTIILSHVLEHIEDPVAYLKRVRPFAGKLLICVPSQENWRYQVKKNLGLDPRTDFSHFREYTREMLQQELSEADFDIREISYNSEGEIFAEARSR